MGSLARLVGKSGCLEEQRELRMASERLPLGRGAPHQCEQRRGPDVVWPSPRSPQTPSNQGLLEGLGQGSDSLFSRPLLRVWREDRALMGSARDSC